MLGVVQGAILTAVLEKVLGVVLGSAGDSGWGSAGQSWNKK